MLIEWTSEYSVGVKEIDEQHQNLVKILNGLYSAVNEGKSEQILDEIFEELKSYADYHFSTEEKYFDKFNYINAREHKDQHKGYVEKISLLQKEYKGAETEVSFKLIDFLEDWWLKHINIADKKYTKCFNENNLY